MAAPAPAVTVWTKSLHDVGHPIINEQHKYLFLAINVLAGATTPAERLAHAKMVVKLLEQHFKYEVHELTYNHVANDMEHKALHDTELDQLNADLTVPANFDDGNFPVWLAALRTWFSTHIVEHDKQDVGEIKGVKAEWNLSYAQCCSPSALLTFLILAFACVSTILTGLIASDFWGNDSKGAPVTVLILSALTAMAKAVQAGMDPPKPASSA